MTWKGPRGFLVRDDEGMGPCGLVPSCLYGHLPPHLGGLIEELAFPWAARCESTLQVRRGGKRRQQPGAGPKHDLVFTDRVLITLVYLRHQLPHAALAELYGLERSTITRATGEIRPLLAERGFAVPDRSNARLHTLAPRPRSVAPKPTGPDGGRSSRARGSRTPARPPRSATARAAPYGRGPTGPEECTTRPQYAPRASPNGSDERPPRRQADVVETVVNVIAAHSKHLHLSGYTHFALRDADSTQTGLFHQFGLTTDDYTPKPAFDTMKMLIERLSL